MFPIRDETDLIFFVFDIRSPRPKKSFLYILFFNLIYFYSVPIYTHYNITYFFSQSNLNVRPGKCKLV